jgi:hypothetical protein
MKSLLYYVVQVVICSGILYGYYHLFLRNTKFHLYNRYYLLATVALSIFIPFLNIPVYFSYESEYHSTFLQTLSFISPQKDSRPFYIPYGNTISQAFSLKLLLKTVYMATSSLIIIRFALAILKFRMLLGKYTKERVDHIYFLNTKEKGAPFSFFNWLFWNQEIDLNSTEGQQIFRHELFHIQQKHSWDIIFLEITRACLWINPFFYLIKKETKTIHEFLADEFATIEKDKWSYAELLLSRVLNTHPHHLSNPFFHNQIKRRIAMITLSKRPSFQYLRKLMVLPLAAIVLALFAFNYKGKRENKYSPFIDRPVKVVIDAGHGMDAEGRHKGGQRAR